MSCRRADVTITVPTACMFEETFMHVEVARGNVYMSNISTNFDTVTLYNTNGLLRADDVTGMRMNMNTSIGQVKPDMIVYTTRYVMLYYETPGVHFGHGGCITQASRVVCLGIAGAHPQGVPGSTASGMWVIQLGSGPRGGARGGARRAAQRAAQPRSARLDDSYAR